MSTRRPHVCRLLVLSVAAVSIPTIVRADPPAPTVAGDVQPFVAQVNADDVYVRSGPSEQFYATQKLNAGDRVTVVGIRGASADWVKIVPPAGSFCYVAKVWIDPVAGDATAGRAKKSDLNVRAGSVLNGSIQTVLTTLNAGDPVQILGSLDDKYFKIASPAAAYLYVQRSLVTPVPSATPAQVPLTARANEREPMVSDPVLPPSAKTPPPAPEPMAAATPPAAPPVVVPPPAAQPAAQPAPQPAPVTFAGPLLPATPAAAGQPAAAPVVTTPGPVVVAAAPTTKPVETPVVTAAEPETPAVVAPTTRPTVVAAAKATPSTRPAVVLTPRQRFELAETEFARSSKLPLERQPLEGLRWRYRTLAKDATLPTTIRQTSLARIDALQVRIDARDQMAEVSRTATAAADRQKALSAEHQELSERVKQGQVATFAALGTLRVSSLQQSGATLYRLCDPNTGRTLVYVRSGDAKYAGLLNQFVGVRGPVTTDAAMSLRYVTPTDAEPVDMAKVNNGVSAAISPPSLLGNQTQTNAGGN